MHRQRILLRVQRLEEQSRRVARYREGGGNVVLSSVMNLQSIVAVAQVRWNLSVDLGRRDKEQWQNAIVHGHRHPGDTLGKRIHPADFKHRGHTIAEYRNDGAGRNRGIRSVPHRVLHARGRNKRNLVHARDHAVRG